jgi:dTDP-4-dehydrorhamnose 3,5-epimerase
MANLKNIMTPIMQNNTINPELFEQTGFSGLVIYKPRVFTDERGYFFESFKQKLWRDNGFDLSFVQDNQSFSTRGTLRGLHFQTGEHAQTKLVRVTMGQAQVVVVDLRQSEPTFGQHFSVVLDDQSQYQLLVPRGFAHGFLVLSQHCMYQYKVDNYWDKESEGGLNIFDESLEGVWQLSREQISANDRDKNWPTLANLPSTF